MKKRVLLGICFFLAVLMSGCGGDSTVYAQVSSKAERNSQSAPSASASTAPSSKTDLLPEEKLLAGHLTIKTYWDNDMEVYIQDFTALHPGVFIDLIQPGQDGILSFDDYQTQTAVELLSGNSADIIDVAGLAVFKYAKNGAFCDLYSFMDSDPDFHREDYYTNIFAGKEFEGALYSMPCGFTYDMLYASRHLLEKAQLSLPRSLDYQKMLAIYEKVSAAADKPPKLLPGLSSDTFFYYEYPEYYNIDTLTANFSSPEFLEYLRQTKEISPVNGDSDFTRLGYDDSFLYEDYLFCRFDVSGGSDLCNFLFDFQNVTEPVPLVSTSGKAYFRSMREYAISSSSANQELAWEFIKYYIGEKEPPETTDSPYAEKYYRAYNAFVPINKANFFNSFRFTFEYELPYFEKDPAVQWRDGNRDEMIRKALEQIHSWNQQRNAEQAEGEIYGLLCEDMNSYYNLDLLTPEETADKLQNRMTIFLQE